MPVLEKGGLKELWRIWVITCNKLIFTETVRPKHEKPRHKEEMENKPLQQGMLQLNHVNIF